MLVKNHSLSQSKGTSAGLRLTLRKDKVYSQGGYKQLIFLLDTMIVSTAEAETLAAVFTSGTIHVQPDLSYQTDTLLRPVQP